MHTRRWNIAEETSSLDKVRIIALYILFRDGVADEDRRRLYQHARLTISEQDTINNLIYLGVKVIKVSTVLLAGAKSCVVAESSGCEGSGKRIAAETA